MEELAKKILEKIDETCVEFYLYKSNSLIDKGKEMLNDIQVLCQGIIEILEKQEQSDETISINNYMIECINDYMDSIENEDIILLIDTLDFGVRELANMFVGEVESIDG